MVSTKQDTYHHGDLQKALIDAAHQLVTEAGVEGLSLRQVSQRAGVSIAAPYHHFEDKAALVEALRIVYWKDFADALKNADSVSGLVTQDRLMAIGKAYIQFGLKNPNAFRLIFRSEQYRSGSLVSGKREGYCEEGSPLDLVSREGFEVLFNIIVKGQEEGFLTPGNPLPLALTAWSTVHGITTLLLDGPTERLFLVNEDFDKEVDQLADSVLSILLTGMLKPVEISPSTAVLEAEIPPTVDK